MYPQDHNPPHFHVRAPDFTVLVAIGTGRVIGRTGRTGDIREALAWAHANEELLRREWTRLNP